jgi:queuine tRNA-ribosyltransferase
VHHLFRVNEMLGPILLTIHNLTFYGRMMADARMAISKGRYANFRHEFIARYRGSG